MSATRNILLIKLQYQSYGAHSYPVNRPTMVITFRLYGHHYSSFQGTGNVTAINK
jgi:hypothetical protein